MTPDGAPLLAQHFAMLDANTSHRHTVVFVHHPDSGPRLHDRGLGRRRLRHVGHDEKGLA